jgi:hypothetical protein
MKKLISLLGIFVFLLVGTRAARAQGVGASGNISGTVSDPSGGVVANATVVADESTRGLKFTVASDNNGQYRFTGLAPAVYTLTARISGFQTQVLKGVIVNVGETTVADIHLALATTATQVEVNAEPPVVETERGSQANTLNEEYIEDLPIDRRDYLTFTLLLPGVSDSTRLADDQDFRVKQTPQSGLSFYGSNGRGNSVTVDGGEAGDDAGGVRPTVGQDAVQEFQVNRSNYTAELGGASGASINIATKSGTNDVHGSLFTFVRNDALDERDPFAFSQALAPGQPFNPLAPDSVGQPIKNSLQRYQFGGDVGLPIQKDKTFLFANFEGLYQDAQNAVPLLTDTNIFRPSASQQAGIATVAGAGAGIVPCLSGPVGMAVASQLGLPAPNPTTNLPGTTCAAILTGVLTQNQATNPIANYFINQFEDNGGVFPYNTREYLASVRLDHRFSESDQLALTYRYAHDLEENPDVQSLTGFSAGSSTHDYDNTLQAAWFHQFSQRTQNEFRAQYSYNSFNVIPNEPGQIGIQIAGFANNLGTNIFLPNLTILRRTEIADNFTMIRGKHAMKFGVSELLRGNHTESHTFMPGRFVFGSLQGDLLSPALSSIDSLQAATFGLPQFYQQSFGNPDYPGYTRPLTGFYWQDSFKMTSNFTLNFGLRYEIDSQYKPLNTYYGDFGPRVSFAWDPFKDHKTVIRGGYGIFYGPVDAQIPGVDLSLGVLNANRSTVENQHNAATIPDQVNNAVNTCGIGFNLPPPAPPGAGTIFPGTGASPCTRFISIYADSLLPSGLPIATADQVFKGLFSTGPNGGAIGCTVPPPGQLACVTPALVAAFGIFQANSGPISPLTVLFTNPTNYKPPISQQISIGIEREISKGFSISVSGIYSHTQRLPVALDTNDVPSTPMSTITLANGQTVSYRNWNGSAATDPYAGFETAGPGAGGVYPCAVTTPPPGLPVSPCFVNPLIVQNNQYTSAASALYEGGIVEVKKRFGNNFTLFGNYTYSKAYDTSTDFNSDYGPQDQTDLNAERALSEFDERHKFVVAGVFQSPFKNAFLSGFQLAPIFTYHSGHPFNLLAGGQINGNNHTTNERPVGAPRDSGLGPNFYDFDMRLGWEHKIAERLRLRITGEAFNLFDRTNYASVNNEVGPFFPLTPGFTTFKVRGIKPGTLLADGTTAGPSTPLGFTSAFPMREFQLGARLTF